MSLISKIRNWLTEPKREKLERAVKAGENFQFSWSDILCAKEKCMIYLKLLHNESQLKDITLNEIERFLRIQPHLEGIYSLTKQSAIENQQCLGTLAQEQLDSIWSNYKQFYNALSEAYQKRTGKTLETSQVGGK